MNRGLYIGGTSLVTNQRKMDVLSNNLANINTTGFKKDISITESFPDQLLAKTTRVGERREKIGEDNLEHKDLGNNLHRAKIKEGYFKVETPMETSYLKEIKFIKDEDGFLKTSYKNLDDERLTNYENYILDRNGKRIENPDDIEKLMKDIVFTPKDYVIGTLNAGVKFKKIYTDFTQGGLVETGGKFDIALMGDGFIKLEGEENKRLYTRKGSFSLDRKNYLVDLDGRKVLNSSDEPIKIEGKEVNISEDGRINVDGQNAGRLGIVYIKNKEFLRKVGDSNYSMGIDEDGDEIEAEEVGYEDEDEDEDEDFDVRVIQGYLETSNMNAVEGMVEMISLMRDFEANQKLVRMQDEMLEKATNELGRV